MNPIKKENIRCDICKRNYAVRFKEATAYCKRCFPVKPKINLEEI